MIVALSYVIAVILTIVIAIGLYPIAAIFWMLGMLGKLLAIIFELFGELSEALFKSTTKWIKSMWEDLRNMHKTAPNHSNDKIQWTCECGASNAGNFCNECGKPMPVVSAPTADNTADNNEEK